MIRKKADITMKNGSTITFTGESEDKLRGDPNRVFACYVAPVEKWEKAPIFQKILAAFRRGES